MGVIASVAEPRMRSRYLRRHPSAEAFVGFGDFALYRMSVERAHLVQGFGRIHEIEGALGAPAGPDWAEEAAAVSALNERLTTLGAACRIAGLDPDGTDIVEAGSVGWVAFPEPAPTLAVALVFASDELRRRGAAV